MKIIKLYKSNSGHHYVMFDEIPEMTYEEIGSDYIGSATDTDGNIIFSENLGYRPYGDAFGGRELSLKMKDGSVQKIKDHWFDCGCYKGHGEFIDIGAGTLEGLQKCYVYCGMNINKTSFEIMLDDYYSREKEYEYYEIEEWCKRQYKWYPVIIDGKRLPLMVNEKGGFAERETKEYVYPRQNRWIGRYKRTGKSDKEFRICLFKYKYKLGDRLIKVECKMQDVLKQSLPLSHEEIENICKY